MAPVNFSVTPVVLNRPAPAPGEDDTAGFAARAHGAHSGSTIDAHGAVTQPDHAADTHTVQQPGDHTSITHTGSTVTGAHTHSGSATVAGGTGATGTNNDPFLVVAYMIQATP